MSKTVDVSQQCTFSSAIDVTAIRDRLEIQFLDVHERRAIVIFAGAILNLECQSGELTALEQAEITIYDLPINRGSIPEDGHEAAAELINDFVNQLASTAHSL